MNLGEIYRWVTDQAIGYAARPKYHIYLCEAGWRADGHAFLFINKSNYGSDYPIKKSDYNFFPLPVSYISCSDIVTYSDFEIKKINPQRLGVLSNAHMVELYSAIASSETMVQWQIDLVCDALKAAF